MLISNTVKIKWNSKIKKRYVDLGYVFTKMNDEFDVSVNDLTDGSNAIVSIQCDYCGKVIKKKWCNYIICREETVNKDCCAECKKYKIIDTTKKKYGVNTVFKLHNIKKKIENTNIERYGVKNPFSSDEIKQKIKDVCFKKYGVCSPLQNREILNKVSETCMRRYGVKYYIQTQRFTGDKSPVWKGGVSYSRNERFTSDYVKWRKEVYKRDLYTCQCCGAKSKKGLQVSLNAHHIMNWKDNPLLRYSVENGVTLCEKCHLEFHRIYGKRYNTKEQLQIFIDSYGKKIC